MMDAKIVAGNGGNTKRYGSNGTLWWRPCKRKWNVQTFGLWFVESKWNTHRCKEYSSKVHKNMPRMNCIAIKPFGKSNETLGIILIQIIWENIVCLHYCNACCELHWYQFLSETLWSATRSWELATMEFWSAFPKELYRTNVADDRPAYWPMWEISNKIRFK